MTKTFFLKKGEEVTKEQLREIEEAKKSPIVYDDDPPKLSSDMIKAFRCAVAHRNRRQRG